MKRYQILLVLSLMYIPIAIILGLVFQNENLTLWLIIFLIIIVLGIIFMVIVVNFYYTLRDLR